MWCTMDKKLTYQELEAQVAELKAHSALLQQQLELANQLTTESLETTLLMQTLVTLSPAHYFIKILTVSISNVMMHSLRLS